MSDASFWVGIFVEGDAQLTPKPRNVWSVRSICNRHFVECMLRGAAQMSDLETRRSTQNALKTFAAQPLKVVATDLFNALGYASKKTLDLKPNGLEGFCAMFDPEGQSDG